VDFADYVGGIGDDLEAFGVCRGELQAIEEDGGPFGLDRVAGEGVDDFGEGGLDGLAVFECGELDDGARAGEIRTAGKFVAVFGVAVVEAAVEVAEG
jgi:hypothetical protein